MKQINAAVEKNRELILRAAQHIWQNPETGYKEYKTSGYMAEIFRNLGYELTMAEGITGFYTVIDTGRPGPEVLILAELDSTVCPEHKDADPVTGAVHACGHSAQCAAMVGIAAALREEGILDKLSGRIRLCAVPAEELHEIEFRKELIKEGKIKYLLGKSEYLSRGYFDGVDIAFMVHTATSFYVNQGAVGCLAKYITYKGVAAHAGGAPWEGRNALYAATCGLNAINAIRETFKESDIIRVHPIITGGGTMVNAIPDRAVLESYVRGSSFDAISKANKKVNRALCGAALSLGTNVDITDLPGFAPLVNDKNLIKITAEAAQLAIPEYDFTVSDQTWTASTDMGDLSCIMPVVHPFAGGHTGLLHGSDFSIQDPDAACVASARLQLAMLYILLRDGAERAKQVVEEYKPLFKSKEEYLSYVDKINRTGDRITYNEDETSATVDIE
ncbi:MAG: amidohydrolase [Clostridia bacterium]|nr:amidohydrolase [Clostridia bacterium]